MAKKEEKNIQRVHKLSILERLHRSIGPVAGGMILDFADLATFGPLGFYLGPIATIISALVRFAEKTEPDE